MDAFSYLSVLISIILGLAITQILQGYRALLLSRERVAVGGPALLWSFLVLLFATQFWWASFGLRDHLEWTFLGFLAVLLQTGLVYMMAAVVLPEVGDRHMIELPRHFEHQRKHFFGFLIAILVSSVVKDLLLDGGLPETTNLLFHLILGITAMTGILVRSPRVQWLLAIAAGAGFALYVTLLFARLQGGA